MKPPLPLYFRVYSDGSVDPLSFTAQPPAERIGWMEVTRIHPVGCPDNPEEITLLGEIRDLLVSIRKQLRDQHEALMESEGIKYGGASS